MIVNLLADHNQNNLHFNLSVAQLIEASLKRNEGVLTSDGALCTETGIFTGRSPKDKYIVDDPNINPYIDWGKHNQSLNAQSFEGLLERAKQYLEDKELFVFDGYAGADPNYNMPIRVINELAWQNLFARQLFVRPKQEHEKVDPKFTIIALPYFKADPALDKTNSETVVAISFKHKIVLIAGTRYAGEIKKSVFSIMNYLLPEKNVLPMHCSASINSQEEIALFFGLSGTGKTTLSASANWRLVGDDEHGWSPSGIFNIEGGCYAKCINLRQEREPQIWSAIKFGAVLENIVLDKDRVPLYDDTSLTENTRAAYPVEHIPNAVIPGVAGHPKVILFLTADAFGILPPISKLEKDQIIYHFLSGYTSKLAGTERGVTQPEATFSACFGAPFLPRSPKVYAEMLANKVAEHDISVFLVNTGWTGGTYGVGNRIDLDYTRAMVLKAVETRFEHIEFNRNNRFGLAIPAECKGVPSEILNPRNTWTDKMLYDEKAEELAKLFEQNYKQFL